MDRWEIDTEMIECPAKRVKGGLFKAGLNRKQHKPRGEVLCRYFILGYKINGVNTQKISL